ncbi:hypothetical protein BT63DRAFT_438283 [Microthyrium microscopicum]|uniref:Ricin B lectin n=1 Tax=Microthyrium microscopicum TaxID=703497 RepID=A0A6A6UJW1_9PEZI|nr:hypothetical protein BT63DRAFT_438283 [Microthyrium microscopicum]
MYFHLLTLIWVYASFASATITFRLQKAANPTADQADAYTHIESVMRTAIARYSKYATRPNKNITVQYVPSVATADGNFNGNLRFGKGRQYMNERTALHEIAHTLGIGQTKAFDTRCAANNWPSGTKLLRTWDGPNAKINCGGGHIWPYGLNYDKEMSETNAVRHCSMYLNEDPIWETKSHRDFLAQVDSAPMADSA